MKQVAVELSPITVPYPKYVLEYVSAGGNSGQKTFRLQAPPPHRTTCKGSGGEEVGRAIRVRWVLGAKAPTD